MYTGLINGLGLRLDLKWNVYTVQLNSSSRRNQRPDSNKTYLHNMIYAQVNVVTICSPPPSLQYSAKTDLPAVFLEFTWSGFFLHIRITMEEPRVTMVAQKTTTTTDIL